MDEARFSSLVSSGRTRSNGLKRERRKCHTNMQKNFFAVRVTGLPREVVESPSMENYDPSGHLPVRHIVGDLL